MLIENIGQLQLSYARLTWKRRQVGALTGCLCINSKAEVMRVAGLLDEYDHRDEGCFIFGQVYSVSCLYKANVANGGLSA